MNKEEMKLFNCNSEEELFDYLIDIKKSGQDDVVLEIIERMFPRQKKNFIHYLHDLYMQAPDEITWLSYKVTEML